MRFDAHPSRQLRAIAFPFVPLFLFLLPGLVGEGPYATPEEQLTAIATGESPYVPLLLQVVGAVSLVPASLLVLGVARGRGRGRAFAAIGATVGLVGETALLLALGMELGQGFMLTAGSDTASMVDAALAMTGWPLLVVVLVAGTAGSFLGLPLLALALWRCRVVPGVVPMLFVLPVAAGFLPLPHGLAQVLPPLCAMVPCVWIAVRLISPAPARSGPDVSAPGPRDAMLA